MPSTPVSPSIASPPAVSMVNGVLLNEKMPRFAHPMFLNRLFVLTPNIRFGRT